MEREHEAAVMALLALDILVALVVLGCSRCLGKVAAGTHIHTLLPSA